MGAAVSPATGDPFVGSGWCCGICFDVNALLQRGRPVDDVVDYTRLDPPTIAARALRHGHPQLAARVHPASVRARTVVPVPEQQTLPGVA